jgi:hypothetical protein
LRQELIDKLTKLAKKQIVKQLKTDNYKMCDAQGCAASIVKIQISCDGVLFKDSLGDVIMRSMTKEQYDAEKELLSSIKKRPALRVNVAASPLPLSLVSDRSRSSSWRASIPPKTTVKKKPQHFTFEPVNVQLRNASKEHTIQQSVPLHRPVAVALKTQHTIVCANAEKKESTDNNDAREENRIIGEKRGEKKQKQ